MAVKKYKVIGESISYRHQSQRIGAVKGDVIEILDAQAASYLLVNGYVEVVTANDKKSKAKK